MYVCNLLALLNASELFWNRITNNHIQVQKGKEKLVVSSSCPP